MSTELRGLHLSHRYHSGLGRRGRTVEALNDVSLTVAAGKSSALVGSSGSGKSTLLRPLLALERPTAGTVELDGAPVRPGSASSLRWYRRTVQYVPQNPAGSLDPRMTVHQLLLEPLQQLRIRGYHHSMTREALERVDLDPDLIGRRPGELSGGQNQRVAIARALVTSPRLLLADEPVSGLDLPLRETVLTLLDRLVSRDGLGLLFVSHDLAAVAQLCTTRTIVLSSGQIAEQGATAELLANPRHPDTRQLIAAIPRLPAPTERAGTKRLTAPPPDEGPTAVFAGTKPRLLQP